MAKPDLSRHRGVSDRQLRVIDALLCGSTHLEAAAAAGVARTTVTDWANHSSDFIAELNCQRRDRLKVSADRAASIVMKGLLLIEREIDGGDVAAAFALLKLYGLAHLNAVCLNAACSPVAVEIEMARHLESEQFAQLMTENRAYNEVKDRSNALIDLS